MNYHQYYPVDIVNGPGTRAPCSSQAASTNAPAVITRAPGGSTPGCHSPPGWPIVSSPTSTTRGSYARISLSGGDPLHPQNVPEILALVRRILAECPGKDIWVWTGYKLDELNDAQREVVDLINVLVDGKFVEDLKDPALIWRGSSNQVVHRLR